MTTKNSCVFTRCSPAIVLMAFLAFNTTAQAQDLSDGSAAATSAVFTVEKTPNPCDSPKLDRVTVELRGTSHSHSRASGCSQRSTNMEWCW